MQGFINTLIPFCVSIIVVFFINDYVVDLGLSPHRKLPNIYLELFGVYGAGDYANVFKEFERHLLTITEPLRPVDTDM